MVFSAHSRGLALGNSLGAFRHKQDSKPILRITQYVVVRCFSVSNLTTICRFFGSDYSGSFSAYAATHHVVFSPQKCCTSKVESGINKCYSDSQITIRIVTFSESIFVQLAQGEIRNKEMPFRIADNSKRSELQMTKISMAASSKSLPVILEVESGINKGYSDLQITTRLPLTSWARIPFASAIRHKQIGFIFTANKKAHRVTCPCCLWIKQVGKRPSGPHGYLVVGA